MGRQVFFLPLGLRMSIAVAWPQCLDLFGTPLVIEPSPDQLSGDAGLLPIRQFDQRIGLTRAFAEALDDPRDPDLAEHTFLEMAQAPTNHLGDPATAIESDRVLAEALTGADRRRQFRPSLQPPASEPARPRGRPTKSKSEISAARKKPTRKRKEE
jgi:hypothetical protein